jgi:hypothetical protein
MSVARIEHARSVGRKSSRARRVCGARRAEADVYRRQELDAGDGAAWFSDRRAGARPRGAPLQGGLERLLQLGQHLRHEAQRLRRGAA